MMFIIAVATWLSFGCVDAGFSYAYLQRQYPSIADKDRVRDTILSLICILFGPASLMASYCQRWTRHGWLFPGSKP